MSVQLLLFLDRSGYFPGDWVTGTVKIVNTGPNSPDAPSAIIVRKLVVCCSGTERTDPTWFRKLHKPEGIVSKKDGKRTTRNIFSTDVAHLIVNGSLASGASKSFAVRVRLPPQLPPSFKGTAVRYQYMLEAVATCDVSAPDSPANIKEASTNLEILVWPAPVIKKSERRIVPHGTPAPAGAATAGSSASGSAAGAASAAAAAGGGGGGGGGGADEPEVVVQDYKLDGGAKLRWEELGEGGAAVAPSRRGSGMQVAGLVTPLPHGTSTSFFNSQSEEEEDEAGSSGDESSDGGRGNGESPQSPTAVAAVARASSTALLHKRSAAGKTFQLSANDIPLVKLLLQPPMEGAVCSGCTFGGILDFRGSGLLVDDDGAVCRIISVMLQAEEIVHDEYRAHAKGSDAQAAAIQRLVCEHQEIAVDTMVSHFTFSIPQTATPTFSSPMVSVRWVIRLEIQIGQAVNRQVSTPGDGAPQQQRGLAALEPQQLMWTVPLHVSPPSAFGAMIA